MHTLTHLFRSSHTPAGAKSSCSGTYLMAPCVRSTVLYATYNHMSNNSWIPHTLLKITWTTKHQFRCCIKQLGYTSSNDANDLNESTPLAPPWQKFISTYRWIQTTSLEHTSITHLNTRVCSEVNASILLSKQYHMVQIILHSFNWTFPHLQPW
jgi:hypothetical protein